MSTRGNCTKFGPFRLLPAERQLLKGEAPVQIGSRELDILIALVERAGEVVSKRELFTRVWPDVVVEAVTDVEDMVGRATRLHDYPVEEPHLVGGLTQLPRRVTELGPVLLA